MVQAEVFRPSCRRTAAGLAVASGILLAITVIASSPESRVEVNPVPAERSQPGIACVSQATVVSLAELFFCACCSSGESQQ
jgi:hypothetical protein